NTWIRPLQVEADGEELRVYAPNRFVLDWVNEKYLSRLLELLAERATGMVPVLSLLIGSKRTSSNALPSASVARAQSQVPVAAVAQSNQDSRSSAPSLIEPPQAAPAPAVRTERNVQVEG